MKGQTMLKVCSILMIIGGAFVLVFAIIAAIALAALLAGADGTVPFIAILIVVISCLYPILELVAGIIGVKAAGMPSVGKIKAALVCGLLVVLFALFSNVYNLLTSPDPFAVGSIISIALGLVVPVLYLVGLIRFKNALVALLSGE